MNNSLRSFIPLDKSWIIRMGILDMLYADSRRIEAVLKSEKRLCDDLLALRNVVENWNSSSQVNVGESGTLYRLLLYICWKLELEKEFIISGTLKTRAITINPDIVNLTQQELLDLDHNTSQWASAAVLCGDIERITKPPFKLRLTYEAWDYWHEAKAKNHEWQAREDKTILKQAESFLRLLRNTNLDFVPEQAEDYPFAFVFGKLDERQGVKLWPSLQGHESNRIDEVTSMLELAKNGLQVSSNDHRVVQSIAMWGRANDIEISFSNPNCVNKSWPQFWDFLNASTKLALAKDL